MQIFPGVYGRKPYNERNADIQVIEYQRSDIAPHIRALRDIYILDVNKSLRLDMLDVSMLRVSASSTESEVTTEFELTKGDLSVICLHLGVLFSKLKGGQVDHEHDSTMFINGPATLRLYTTDPSQSGTVTYSSRLLFQVFDK